MSELSLGALIQEDELNQRGLQPDAIGTPCWNGERDVDELVAAAMEAIEGDVTNYYPCMDLIQTIQEVFDHAVFQ